jgi:hypothetical protein
MKTEFRKSFEKDLKNIKDSNLLERVKLFRGNRERATGNRKNSCLKT